MSKKAKQKKTSSQPTETALRFPAKWLFPAAFGFLTLLATVVYSNTFSSPFQFDDVKEIVENTRLRGFSSFLAFPDDRYIGRLSFAVNYALGGLDVFGYHLGNLLIHIGNGFLVFGLVWLLIKALKRKLAEATPFQSKNVAFLTAFATALLFVSHPVQTQAVTYVIQRYTSLAVLFYLLSVVLYLVWRLDEKGKKTSLFFYVGSILAFILAIRVKQIAYTLPLTLLLTELVFFRDKKKLAYLLPFVPLILFGAWPYIQPVIGQGIASSGIDLPRETVNVSRYDYLLTEIRVIVTYLRLLVLPVAQNLDYDYRLARLSLEVLLSLVLLISLLAGAAFLLYRAKSSKYAAEATLISFGIFWFFLALSVESSVIPIRDVIFEHRLYLPSFGFFLAAVISGIVLARYVKERQGLKVMSEAHIKPLGIALAVIVLALSIATYNRNAVWKDEITLLEDVARKSPEKPRAHLNLADSYREKGRLEDAIYEAKIAVESDPEMELAWLSLGLSYNDLGKYEEAIQALKMVTKLSPGSSTAYNVMGNVYEDQGMLDEAAMNYRLAIKLDPQNARAHNNLAIVLYRQGKAKESIEELKKAISLRPELAEFHYNLGLAYQATGEKPKAAAAFRQALAVEPGFEAAEQALNSLGN